MRLRRRHRFRLDWIGSSRLFPFSLPSSISTRTRTLIGNLEVRLLKFETERMLLGTLTACSSMYWERAGDEIHIDKGPNILVERHTSDSQPQVYFVLAGAHVMADGKGTETLLRLFLDDDPSIPTEPEPLGWSNTEDILPMIPDPSSPEPPPGSYWPIDIPDPLTLESGYWFGGYPPSLLAGLIRSSKASGIPTLNAVLEEAFCVCVWDVVGRPDQRSSSTAPLSMIARWLVVSHLKRDSGLRRHLLDALSTLNHILLRSTRNSCSGQTSRGGLTPKWIRKERTNVDSRLERCTISPCLS